MSVTTFLRSAWAALMIFFICRHVYRYYRARRYGEGNPFYLLCTGIVWSGWEFGLLVIGCIIN